MGRNVISPVVGRVMGGLSGKPVAVATGPKLLGQYILYTRNASYFDVGRLVLATEDIALMRRVTYGKARGIQQVHLEFEADKDGNGTV